MYKSLLRKIEFLAPLRKVWRLHFLAPTYSSAHMRLSACLLGVFSPNTAQQRCTVCPTVPPHPDPLPVVEEGGEKEPGSQLGHGCRGRGYWRWRVACLSNKWVNTSESGKMSGRLSGDSGRPRRSPTVTPRMATACVPPPRDQVDMLFYSGGEVWVVRRKPAPHRRKRIGRGMKEEREGGRERLFRAWFLSFIVCLLRFEYSLSQQMRKMPQTLALLASSLFFSICN